MDWLEQRRPAMPGRLLDAVLAAMEESGDGTAPPPSGDLPDRLARAGLDALARVARSAPDRSTAPELLAADALLTYACEAAAEAGPETLDRLLEELGYDRFDALLEPSVP